MDYLHKGASSGENVFVSSHLHVYTHVSKYDSLM